MLFKHHQNDLIRNEMHNFMIEEKRVVCCILLLFYFVAEGASGVADILNPVSD